MPMLPLNLSAKTTKIKKHYQTGALFIYFFIFFRVIILIIILISRDIYIYICVPLTNTVGEEEEGEEE